MASALQLETVYKVGYAEPIPRRFSFGDVFAYEDRKGTPLLCVGTKSSQVDLLKKLAERMPEPLWLLYVLVVSRGEGEPGRYQSAELFTLAEVDTFLDRFQNYLEADARYNLWIKSAHDPALLVYESHNLIYCYGPIDVWAGELQQLGWQEVKAGTMLLPDPHEHHYHEILDDDAKSLLTSTEWIHSPLREQDQ